MLFGQLRRELGPVPRELATQRESKIEEGHLHADHVHMLISIPPKHSAVQVVGHMKGKSAIYVARRHLGRGRNFVGENFWARGYFVSRVGRDEKAVREYIKSRKGKTSEWISWKCSDRDGHFEWLTVTEQPL